MGNPLAEILSGGTSIRTTLTNTNFVSSAGAVYQVAVTSVFASNTASGTSTTPLVTSKVTRLYPLSNALRAQETTVDVRGNSATTSESYNPTSHTHTIVRSYPGISNLESAVQRDGLLLSSVSILGGTTSFAYDGLHRQVAQTDPRGNVTSQVYNSYGQVASVIEPTGAVTTYGYDNMGRMTRVVNALGGTVSYTYNPRGQKLSESGNATYPVEYEYDDDTGKLSAHCLHRNSNTDDRTYYYYDSCTQLLKEKCDANGNSVRYEYDSNGLLSKRTWARSTSNGADLITSYTYNVFGELTSVSYNDTTPNVSFTRDALGREVGRSDGAGSHTTAYNAYGEVTSERFPLATNSSAVISRTYDSLGRPKTVLLKGTTAAAYTYDAATGRYATVKNNSATVTYSYLDKTNLPSVQTWKKGTSSAFLTVSNTYDAYNRLTQINANSSNQAAYVYDSLGRRTSATLQDDTAWNYTYNQRSEITSAIRKNASNVMQNNMRYVFDNIGNRTSSYEDATSKTYDANSLNQYTEIDVTGGSSVCPLYDDDGNMTQFDSSTYTYDAENRLVGALNGNTRLEFIYDALGRRVAKKLYQYDSLSKHERYVYDGMKLLATYNAKSSFAKINSFLWQPFGLDVPLIMTYNSTVYGYLVDANKNVLGLFNPSKTRVATYLYGPFGQKLSESGTIAANNPLQFSSEQFDADLGLIYYNYRYYLPSIGKWLTKDPIGEQGGWNLYAFCGNNATVLYDHLGFNWFERNFYNPVVSIANWTVVKTRSTLEYVYDTTNAALSYAYNQTADTLEETYNSISDSLKYLYQGTLEEVVYMYNNPTYAITNFFALPRYAAGLLISALSGDLFRGYDEPQFSGNTCRYAFSINGVFNTDTGLEKWEKDIPNYINKSGEEPMIYNHIKNHTTFLGDIIQVIGDELGLISIPSIRAARSINRAGENASLRCGDCYDIYIIAHSQGTAIFQNALYLIKPEYKRHITFLGFGGQVLSNSTWELKEVYNFINTDDIVPIFSNIFNPLRFGLGLYSLVANHKEFGNKGGLFFSHKFDTSYSDMLKKFFGTSN